jgi:hypothetical protein
MGIPEKRRLMPEALLGQYPNRAGYARLSKNIKWSFHKPAAYLKLDQSLAWANPRFHPIIRFSPKLDKTWPVLRGC